MRIGFSLLFIFLLLILIGSESQAQEKIVPFVKENKWGYIDEHGKIVIKPQFIFANDFSAEGIAAVVDDIGWAYIDTRGNVIIRPFIFDNGPDYFQEGLARFTVENRFGFFDKAGEIVIEPQFDFTLPFHEGLSAVCMECKEKRSGEHSLIEGGKWGYINTKGEIVIELKFEHARNLENGIAHVKLDGEWIYIDKSGVEVSSSAQSKLSSEAKSSVLVQFDLRYMETTYSIAADTCEIRWIVHNSDVNKGIVRHRSECNLPLKEQVPLLSKILARILEDCDNISTINTLFIGRLIHFSNGPSEMSRRLAIAAKQSSLWDTGEGKPISGHENDFVVKLANKEIIYSELKDLFQRFNLTIEVVNVEKVLITNADKLPFFPWLKRQGIRDTHKLPYDCLLWFSISKK